MGAKPIVPIVAWLDRNIEMTCPIDIVVFIKSYQMGVDIKSYQIGTSRNRHPGTLKVATKSHATLV